MILLILGLVMSLLYFSVSYVFTKLCLTLSCYYHQLHFGEE